MQLPLHQIQPGDIAQRSYRKQHIANLLPEARAFIESIGCCFDVAAQHVSHAQTAQSDIPQEQAIFGHAF